MLKQNDIINLTITNFGSDGEGVGKYQDYTVFVKGLLPEETAQVVITYAKKNVAYGNCRKVIEASPFRVNPACKYFGTCGGCSLMHMDYAQQLLFKQNKVKNNLKKIGGIDIDVQPTVASEKILGYRNKLSLPVSGTKGNVKIGMYQQSTHQVIDLKQCLLGGEWSDKLVQIFRDYLNSYGIEPYDEKTFSGQVRHLIARYIDGQLLVTVVSNGRFKGNLQPFADELQKHFDKVGLFVNQNTQKNNVILGDKTHYICGIKEIKSRHFGVDFKLGPVSFFQVNDGVKDAIYSQAKTLLDSFGTEVLIDCFSGVGILTGALCSNKYHTYAIEIDSAAVSDAEATKQLNNITNLTNLCGDVAVVLPDLIKKIQGKKVSVVVDPPRKGLGDKVCSTLCQIQPDSIVYISCNSATLARDIKLLSSCYTVSFVRPFDMFPNTSHVETVVLLTSLHS